MAKVKPLQVGDTVKSKMIDRDGIPHEITSRVIGKPGQPKKLSELNQAEPPAPPAEPEPAPAPAKK
jgi:hypothetical protein